MLIYFIQTVQSVLFFLIQTVVCVFSPLKQPKISHMQVLINLNPI